jgi:hypothetical protein
MTPVSPGGNRLTGPFGASFKLATAHLGQCMAPAGRTSRSVGPAGFFRMSKNTLISLKSLQKSRVCHVLM